MSALDYLREQWASKLIPVKIPEFDRGEDNPAYLGPVQPAGLTSVIELADVEEDTPLERYLALITNLLVGNLIDREGNRIFPEGTDPNEVLRLAGANSIAAIMRRMNDDGTFKKVTGAVRDLGKS